MAEQETLFNPLEIESQETMPAPGTKRPGTAYGEP